MRPKIAIILSIQLGRLYLRAGIHPLLWLIRRFCTTYHFGPFIFERDKGKDESWPERGGSRTHGKSFERITKFRELPRTNNNSNLAGDRLIPEEAEILAALSRPDQSQDHRETRQEAVMPAQEKSSSDCKREVKILLEDIPIKPAEIEARFKDKFFLTELFLAWNEEAKELIRRAENPEPGIKKSQRLSPSPIFQRITQIFQFWADHLGLGGTGAVSNFLKRLTEFRLAGSSANFVSSFRDAPTVEELKNAAQEAKDFLERLMDHTMRLNAAQPQGKVLAASKPESEGGVGDARCGKMISGSKRGIIMV